MAVTRSWLRFAVVGSIGFVVDSSTLLLLVKGLGVPPLPARVLSFLLAASVTFVLNHRFTFRYPEPLRMRRWAYYVVTTSLGACVNIGIYQLWISAHGRSALQLALGTAIGSLVAMTLNFFISSTWIFRTPQRQASARIGASGR
jgi:putative flippase GtrA